MQSLVEAYSNLSPALKEQARLLESEKIADSSQVIDMKFCRLLSPLPRPRRNVICVGKNYVDHVREVAKKAPAGNISASEQLASKYAAFFTKAPDCVIGPEDTIPNHSRHTKYLDYEVELAVVIGKEGSDVSKDEAMQHVMGVSVSNDITARDIQKRHNQWFKGKSLDGTCPIGPYIVPLDTLEKPPSDLAIRLWVCIK